MAVTVFIVKYYGGIKLGKRRYKINAMLTTAALTTLQYKMLQWQSTRNRALSQGSIAYSISGASDIKEIPNNEVRWQYLKIKRFPFKLHDSND